MTFTSTITSKGQITIPKKIRVALGLEPSQKISFYKEKGRVFIEPVPDFLSLEGKFKVERPIKDWKKLRQEVKKAAAKQIIQEAK